MNKSLAQFLKKFEKNAGSKTGGFSVLKNLRGGTVTNGGCDQNVASCPGQTNRDNCFNNGDQACASSTNLQRCTNMSVCFA